MTGLHTFGVGVSSLRGRGDGMEWIHRYDWDLMALQDSWRGVVCCRLDGGRGGSQRMAKHD